MIDDERPDTPEDPILLAVWAYGTATLSVFEDPTAPTGLDMPRRVLIRLHDGAGPRYIEVETILPSLATLGEVHRHAIAAAPGLVTALAAEPPAPTA